MGIQRKNLDNKGLSALYPYFFIPQILEKSKAQAKEGENLWQKLSP